MQPLATRLQEAARIVDQHFLDKQEIIRLMVISVVAGEHLILVGPPGTAKSALIRLFARLVDARYFEYLLTRFTEPNELFGVLVTVLRLAMEALETQGGLIEVHTSLSTDGQRVRTEVRAPKAPLSGNIASILEPAAGAPEELSPLHFEWALAQETVKTQYGGGLTWQTYDGAVQFILELPLNRGNRRDN